MGGGGYILQYPIQSFSTLYLHEFQPALLVLQSFKAMFSQNKTKAYFPQFFTIYNGYQRLHSSSKIYYIHLGNKLPTYRDGFQHKSLELKLNISEVLKNAWAQLFLKRVKARSAQPPGFPIYRRLDLSLITYGTFDLKYLNIERELQLGLFVNSSTQVTRLHPLLYMLKCPPSSSTTKLSIYLVIKHSKHHSPSCSGSIHNPSVCLLCT